MCIRDSLDKDWRVLADINLWHDAYASKRYASLIQQDVSSNENNPSSLINNIVDSLQVQYSERTKINMNIFEKIHLTSTDMVVTKRGLPYPIMVPIFPILTTDDRIDYGSTMK